MRSIAAEGNELQGEGQKIGVAPHRRRNLWLLFGLLAAAFTMAAYYALLGRHNASEMQDLERFRAAYAQKCHAPRFAEPTPPMLKELYLSSSLLQAVIRQQSIALEGGASCEVVSKALRAADFPVPGLS
jgi:hypothetical protein